MDQPTLSLACGIIPLLKQKGQWKVFLISHRGYEQYWCCPKGRLESGESPEETARRELKEETNLDIKQFLQKEPLLEEFTFIYKGESILKRVLYFIAEVEGTILLESEEIANGQWFTLPEAIEKTGYPEGKVTLREVQELLQ